MDHLIACVGNNVCAYVSNHKSCLRFEGQGLRGYEVKWLAERLVDHGYKRCGQIAKGSPFEDEYGRLYLLADWCQGWLKFDWVEDGFEKCGIDVDDVQGQPGGICDLS